VLEVQRGTASERASQGSTNIRYNPTTLTRDHTTPDRTARDFRSRKHRLWRHRLDGHRL